MIKIKNKNENEIKEKISNFAITTLKISYNTYLMLTTTFKRLIVSSTKTGRYSLKKVDHKNNFYFNYCEMNLFIKIPFNAVLDTNGKLKGILGISFTGALDCPSKKRGLCQLPNDALCYACKGQKRASKKSSKMLYGMDSTANTILCSYFWEHFYKDAFVRASFIKYIKYYGIKTIRFNLRGDLRHSNDIECLKILSNHVNKLYGYTARDDLYKDLLDLISHENVYLNGSNVKYTNRFYCTTDLKEYANAYNRCINNCKKCGNCYNLKNKTITVLLHGIDSDKYLKTPDNIKYLSRLLNIDINAVATCKNKGLLKSIKKVTGVNLSHDDLLNILWRA